MQNRSCGWLTAPFLIFLASRVVSRALNFFLFFLTIHQVSPDLYGDNNTRLFTYWTVSFCLHNPVWNESNPACEMCLCWCILRFVLCRVMPTRQQGATTCCVQGSFRSTARSPWEPASSPSQATPAHSMTSAYWSGRWGSISIHYC